MTKNKQRILITGGTGSWGNGLVSPIVDQAEIGEIVIYSRGEQKQVEQTA